METVIELHFVHYGEFLNKVENGGIKVPEVISNLVHLQNSIL
jgi:hypothetical protein